MHQRSRMPTNLISAPLSVLPVRLEDAGPGSGARVGAQGGSPQMGAIPDSEGGRQAPSPLGSWLALLLAAMPGDALPAALPQSSDLDTGRPDAPSTDLSNPEKLVEKGIANWAWLLAGWAPVPALLPPPGDGSSRQDLSGGSPGAPGNSIAHSDALIAQILGWQPPSIPAPAVMPSPESERRPAESEGLASAEALLRVDPQNSPPDSSTASPLLHPPQVQVERINAPSQSPLAPADLAFAVTLRSLEEPPAASAPPKAGAGPVLADTPKRPIATEIPGTVPMAMATPLPPLRRENAPLRSPDEAADAQMETAPVVTSPARPVLLSRPMPPTELPTPQTTVSPGLARLSAPFTHRAEPGNGSTAPPASQGDPKSQSDPATTFRSEARGSKAEPSASRRTSVGSPVMPVDSLERPASTEPALSNPNPLPAEGATGTIKTPVSRVLSQPISPAQATLDVVRAAVIERGASPAPALREVAFRVTDVNRAAQATVQLFERDGRIQVAVRTPDMDLAKELRTGLNELLTSLEKSGFRSESWKLSAVEGGSNEPMHDSTQNGGRHQTATSDAGRDTQQQSRNPFRRTPNDEAEANLAEEWNPWM